MGAGYANEGGAGWPGRAGPRARGAFVRRGRRGRSGRSGRSAVSERCPSPSAARTLPLSGPGPVMTLEELPGERRAAGRMEQAGDALEEVLSKALSQRSLTLGVYEAAKLLNVDPDNVVLCLLAAEEEEAGDAALQIHFTLLRAFCCENDINILRVSNPARLAELLLPAAGPDPPADLHCVLVTNPQASQWKDPALSQLMCFCRESRYLDQWVPVINLPER
ncbi:growth arrest and DNA damage-inducible protein GADD45 alpha [Motacilla alba alba]|nr:growth arrest and DNA damage-inducible protein GADD45 alpha [Motacilla alba alba]